MKTRGVLLRDLVLFGNSKDHEVGFMTNPEMNTRTPYLEVNGEKIVCIAKAGECRFNHKYFDLDMSSDRTWTTPIIDENCPNSCGYKQLVCDDHSEKGCEESFTPYARYNKFSGLFKRFCRDFRRLKS